MINQFRGEYFFLSNFFESPIIYRGISYKNNEAAFQAQKVNSHDEQSEFSNLTPADAKRKGRRVRLRKDVDWDSVKTTYMYEIVKAKFMQNAELRIKLLETGNEHLEEGNTWGDRIWGTVNGVGQNRLGKILMRVREELK
ncbi:NADAR family protein [uncultured Robinsoniella sp.]|uniref:NADAR family protein n=1 Tax=uncultured Robinsoniella sp. TaxID=904190 RepID=UPI00374EABF6